MTSPKEPSTKSVTGRLSRTFATGGSRRANDPDARHTRNVTIAFIGLIAATAIILLVALLYGFWEANLKPLANVGGVEVSRAQWDDRQRLETFRADRADVATRAALLAGDLDEDLANRRLTETTNARAAGPAAVMNTLVDLIFQRQLAEQEGVTLSEDDLSTAIEADGTFPEMRRISALVVQPTGAATGQATADDRAEARQRAEAALAELRSGTPLVDLVAEYSPATAANDGDLGYGSLEDLQSIDPVWADALFALEEGGISDIVESAAGDLLIGEVTSVVPESPDDGFLAAVNEDVGEAIHRRNVELEATSQKLEETVTADALAAEYDQVRLAEILIAGDALSGAEDDEGTIRASHILYKAEEADPSASPDPGASTSPTTSASPAATTAAAPSPGATSSPAAAGSPAATATAMPAASSSPAAAGSPAATATAMPAASSSPAPSADATADPALEAARVKAEATAAELRAITDPVERMEAFAARAAVDGTDSTAQTGGDLGFFARGDMVPEFADALFDAVDPQQGDIIGPVQSEFGWHVIMFNEARGPLAERLAAAQDALAADGAEFATVAAEHSDGAEAAEGGETGWQVVEDLDPASQLALEIVDVGDTTEPVATDAGWVIYQKLEAASRPLDGDAALRKAATAFEDWYQELRFDAEDAGEISIDDSVSAESDAAALGA